MARPVAIVPHTHWDREWYAPFQAFRLKLVELLDAVLPRLEGDPAFAHFMLDGQMAMVDDYLAVRPEAEERLRRLAAAGRVSVGPWYVLMDEFLVSGETIVRDLQLGTERAAAFGGAMPVGYLPDMFGHVAQMPQLLRLAGIEHAVVWRGVPAAVDRTAFWWESPDGSRVRAEYLWSGYGNGQQIEGDAKELVQRVRAHEAELADALLGGILFLNGSDHQEPQPWLGRVVHEANELQDWYRFEVTSLARYLAGAPTDGLPEWTGELRSSARANLLMGVASNRVDVKQAAARAERALERLAEPLSALFLPPAEWPDALLRAAWLEVVRNAAHDSICACSVDEVVAAVLHRYAEARHIGEGLTERAVGALAASTAEPGVVVANPSARARTGYVEVTLPGEGEVEGAQVLSARPGTLLDLAIPGSALVTLLHQTRNRQFDTTTFLNGVDVDDDGERIELRLKVGVQPEGELDFEAARAGLLARVEEDPGVEVRLRVEQAPSRRLLLRVPDVPGLGWATWSPQPLDVAPVSASADAGGVLDNGLVRVEVDPSDGTFSVDGLAGLDRLVDDGDAGDTYNYSPPDGDSVVDRPSSVAVRVLDGGPLRARLEVVRRYSWPERLKDGARVGSIEVEVTTQLELRAGERLVRVRTELDNRCRDHRLRAWFPLPEPATVSRAECAFAVVERGLEAEGGPGEHGLPTFPSRRFVSAGALTVVHEGLLEYELVDGGRALALTLLRATGMLSQVAMAYRALPAGPPMRAEGAQVQGRQVLRYGVHVGDADPYALVDDAFLPMPAAEAPGGGRRPPSGSELSVHGAEVSAVRRHPGGLEVRVFNPTPDYRTVTVEGRWGWVVDLRGSPVELFEGHLDLRPWQIVTLHLNEL